MEAFSTTRYEGKEFEVYLTGSRLGQVLGLVVSTAMMGILANLFRKRNALLRTLVYRDVSDRGLVVQAVSGLQSDTGSRCHGRGGVSEAPRCSHQSADLPLIAESGSV